MRSIALLLLVPAACGSGGSSGADAASADAAPGADARTDGPPGPPFDLQDGTWVITNVSRSAGTISHDGALGFTADGTAWIAYSEPLSDPSNDQDIFVSSRGAGGAWSTPAPLTNDTDVQNAFASLMTDGDDVHVVWNGYPEGANDIYHAVGTGGSFSARINLTLPLETEARDDFAPSLALAAGGTLAVAYASHLDVGDLDADIRVLRPPSSTIETAIPSPADGQSCWDPIAAFDDEGFLHVVADCGPVSNEDVVYATDRGGSWTRTPLPMAGRDDYKADLALDGRDVHVVWVGGDEILYAASHDGGAFSTPLPLPGSAVGRFPQVAVDSAHRPIVMFQRANAMSEFDIWVTWAEVGAAFAPARNVTEGTDTSTEWFPYSLLMQPTTGLPHLTFTKLIPGSSPVDSEVMHAEFVPSGD